MASIVIYSTHGIRGFHHKKAERKDRTEYYPVASTARRLGIGEVCLGKTFGFLTVVRDLESGRVLFVDKGKGQEHSQEVDPFGPRLTGCLEPFHH